VIVTFRSTSPILATFRRLPVLLLNVVDERLVGQERRHRLSEEPVRRDAATVMRD